MRTRIALIAAVVAIAAVLAWRWKSSPRPRAEVIAEIDGDLRERATRGFAGVVLLAQDGAVLLHKGYGLADRAAARAITTDTGFDIGSLVKPFTGGAILKLEGGKLRRSDTIARTRSEYSNLGYSLLGAIVEIASGQSYERFVNDVVFRPAGMTRTGYLLPGWTRAQLAVGYKGSRAWGTPLDHPWLADGPSWNLRANGGMISTAGDLHRWLDALDRGAIFTPAEKSAFFSLYIHKNNRGARTLGVAGSNEIFDACYLWYADEHRAVIAITSSDQSRAEKMVPDLARQMREMQ